MRQRYLFPAIALLCAFPVVSLALPIDFTTFEWVDPTVTIPAPGGDNSSALMEEDPGFTVVFLATDFLSVPSDALTIQFDWTFYLGEVDQDDLLVRLYDPATFGSYAGYEVWLTSPTQGSANSDTQVWDISSASFLGSTIGMEFGLNSYPFPDNDAGYNSWAEITNAEITQEEADGAPCIPEASTLILFGSGGLSLLGLYRPWRRRR